MEDKLKEIKLDPYNYICDTMEEMLPKVGRKVFSVASLMPPSLILPDIPSGLESVRSNINLLLMTPPGGGKSQISKRFSEITYYPYPVESITPAKLEEDISNMKYFSLVVGDFSRISRDPKAIKVIEGLTGDEKRVHRATMRKEIDVETEGVAFFCGTSQDISSYLSGGFISRTIPIIIIHTEEDHSEVGNKIASKMGKNSQDKERFSLIKDYYNELLMIQANKNKIKPIIGYDINEKINNGVAKVWDSYSKNINKQLHTRLNWFRELHEFYRFLVSSAMLGIHNRKLEYKKIGGKEGNIITPNKQDVNIALNLMKKNMKLKYDILSMTKFTKNLSDLKDLEKKSRLENLSEVRREIVKNLMNNKR